MLAKEIQASLGSANTGDQNVTAMTLKIANHVTPYEQLCTMLDAGAQLHDNPYELKAC